jgi:hypothetical protein
LALLQSRGVDGTARLRTVVGDIGIAPNSDPERAVVELVARLCVDVRWGR